MSLKSSAANKGFRNSIKEFRERAKSAFKTQPSQAWNQPKPNAPSPISPASVEYGSRLSTGGGRSDTVWMALGVALRGLQNCSKQWPSLMEIASALVNSIELISSVDRIRQDYLALASDLATTIDSLQQYLGSSNYHEVSKCVHNTLNVIQDQINHINQKQQPRMLDRYTAIGQDEDAIIEYYRRIESHFRRLQTSATLSILRDMSDQTASKDLLAERMAGTGETTIMYSICEELDKACQLGASFFCSRLLPECRDATRLVPTVAYQLARFSHPFRTSICDILAEDQDASTYNITTQFEKLVKEPLLEIVDTLPDNVVIVIDALDELSGDGDPRAMLDILLSYATDLPVRFLVSCRPEPGVYDHIITRDEQARAMLHLHDIERSLVQADIETYLADELQSVTPSLDQIRQLAEQAGSLFIYAATALRYILPDRPLVDPHERLRIMLQSVSDPLSKRHRDLDALYATVLSSALEHPDLESKEVENIRLVLHTVIYVKEPMNIKTLSRLLGIDNESTVQAALRPLWSVLHISGSTGVVSTLHASFPDYLISQERAGQYWCNETKQSDQLAQYCFRIMHKELRYNIRGFEASYILDRHVPDLVDRANQFISPQLFYACRYWSIHLEHADESHSLRVLLRTFLTSRLLFWMEVLSVRKCIGAGQSILDKLSTWLVKQADGLDTYKLAKDAQLFVAYFATNAVGRSTPHIYVSMLPLWPKSRPVWKYYGTKTRMTVDVDETKVKERTLALRSTWNNNTIAYSLAVSPDGACIAAGSGDSTVSIWDICTGVVVAGPCEGHSSVVWTVAFSPDGERIASGSGDFTIRVWDAHTGATIAGPFEAHNHVISSVAFSHDGARIVSGSRDGTICVWNSRTGALLTGLLQGHSGWVTSAIFSPGDARMMPGSLDHTLCVWDISNWSTTVNSIEYNATSRMTCVALSLDCTRIASASAKDFNIYIRDVVEGATVFATLEGHTRCVNCMTFSWDGARIISGSDDKTIRVCDTQTGVLLAGPFEGHTDGVCSVNFLLDSECVVSASRDCTIRTWDTQSTSVVASHFEGHKAPVRSLAFSPDGSRIASGSDDRTVRVWDVQTGAALGDEPFTKHAGAVKSVAFSPDGTRIASGSLLHLGCSNGRTGRRPSAETSWIGKLRDLLTGSAQTGVPMSGPLEPQASAVYTVVFSKDSTRVVSGHHAGHIYVWDASTWSIVTRFFQYRTSTNYSTVFSADGTQVISGSLSQGIRIWDIRTGAIVADVSKKYSDLDAPVAFASDTKYFASSLRRHHIIRIWGLQDELDTGGLFEGHTDSVQSVVFSPDNTYIASGADDCTIRIWDRGGDLCWTLL